MPNEIRFAVGTKKELFGSVWKAWGRKNDLYLALRSAGALAKFSFHASGICRYAIVSSAPRQPLETWLRPPPNSDRVTPLFTIIVPHFAVAKQFRDVLPPPNRAIRLIDVPAPMQKVMIRLIAAPREFTEADLMRLPGIKPRALVGTIRLERETIWITSYADKIAENEMQIIERMTGSGTVITLAPGGSAEKVRASLLMHSGHDPSVVVEMPLGQGNVATEPQ